MQRLSWIGIIRHGQSTGNVAAEAAESTEAELIDIAQRDADVPLSDTGRDQAAAVNRWLRALPRDERPDAAVVSPYLRTRQTAEIALAELGITTTFDERLRDRELGVVDLMTRRGVGARLPDEAARRERLGKFYYRPPGGESWADVLLRLRSVLRDIDEEHPDGRVILVGHDVLVSMLRYVLEGLDEEELMTSARGVVIANCSLSSWRRADRSWEAERFNFVEHLTQDKDAHPTAEENVDA